ncbi:hypothetical protein BHE74_00045792 [Ensete ventricosum]|nr:hypothetical protein GW17_00042685 [Ensete ventricosum]RWW48154.1 hypothetical protein BHE74_00045792 [Ensete ventricosum]
MCRALFGRELESHCLLNLTFIVVRLVCTINSSYMAGLVKHLSKKKLGDVPMAALIVHGKLFRHFHMRLCAA